MAPHIHQMIERHVVYLFVHRWEELERESGMQVVHRSGSCVMGRKGTVGESSVNSYASAMKKQNIP